MSLINIEAWEKKDLKEIALKGFKQLDIKITDEVAEQLAVECLTSPQLMQYICLSICTLLEDKNEHIVNFDMLEMAYKSAWKEKKFIQNIRWKRIGFVWTDRGIISQKSSDYGIRF